jgi:hypothetical protein
MAARWFSQCAFRVVPRQNSPDGALPAEKIPTLADKLSASSQAPGALWGRQVPSADQAQALFLDAVSQNRGVYLVECGYTSAARDPLGWLVCGTSGSDGVLSLLIGRLCAGGGTAEVSIAALQLVGSEADRAVDACAPFVSASSVAPGSLAGVVITSVEEFGDLLRKMFVGASAAALRTSSFAVILSSVGLRHAFLLLTEQDHARGLDVLRGLKLRTQEARSTGDEPPSLRTASGVIQAMIRLMSKKKLGDGSLVQALPFVVARIGTVQREDPLGIVATMEAAIVADPRHEQKSKGAKQKHEDSQEKLEMERQQHQQQLLVQRQKRHEEQRAVNDKLAQDITELRSDIGSVDAASRQVLDTHKRLREALRLRRIEFDSAAEAKAALAARVEQLRAVVASARQEVKTLEEQSAAGADADRALEAARTHNRKMAAEASAMHHRLLEEVRQKTHAAVGSIRADAAAKKRDMETLSAAAEGELRAAVEATRRQLAVAEAEKQQTEQLFADVLQQHAAREEQVRRLEQQRETLEQQTRLMQLELVAKGEAERKLESFRAEQDELKKEVAALQGVVAAQSAKALALASQLSVEENNAAVLREAALRAWAYLVASARCLLDEEHEVGCKELALAEARTRLEATKSELHRRSALQTRLPADDVQRIVTKVVDDLQQQQRRKQALLQEKVQLERECMVHADRLHQTMEAQEKELGALRGECGLALERVEHLRRRQRVHFAEREARLLADKATFHRLFDEFLVQIDDESAAAAARSGSSFGPISGATSDSRSTSPAPQNPSSIPATSLKATTTTARRPLTIEEKGEICSLYLAWADQCRRARDAELECVQARSAASNVCGRIEATALELSRARQSIATLEERLRFMQVKEAEAIAELDSFIAASTKQRQMEEGLIESRHEAAREEHRLAVHEVAKQTADCEAKQRDLGELQVVLRSLAAELEESKQSTLAALSEQLAQRRAENAAMEARIAAVARAKKSLAEHTPDTSVVLMSESSNRATPLRSSAGHNSPSASSSSSSLFLDPSKVPTTTRFHF